MERPNYAKIAAYVFLLHVILLISACRSGEKAPDVSHLDGSFALIRTEDILFKMDTLTNDTRAQAAFAAHEEFWNLYFREIMGVGDDTSYHWQVLLRSPYLQAIVDSVEIAYMDMTSIREDFATAFRYLQYYFPGNRVPNVYTLISGFGFFPFIFEDGDRDGLGISLEMFLGSDFPYKSFAGNDPMFSDYLVRTFNKDHLVKKTLDVLVDDLKGPPSGDRLLDLMLHNGIKLYILEHLLPDLPDTVLFEFTPAQLAWCRDNERNLWAHFLTEDLLYSSDSKKIQRLLNPSPLIPGMPSEAPGGVANWTGWRIIHALMEKEPSLKILDLLALHDAQQILERARYRPK